MDLKLSSTPPPPPPPGAIPYTVFGQTSAPLLRAHDVDLTATVAAHVDGIDARWFFATLVGANTCTPPTFYATPEQYARSVIGPAIVRGVDPEAWVRAVRMTKEAYSDDVSSLFESRVCDAIRAWEVAEKRIAKKHK